jgi:hypothetical protein
VIQTKKDDNVLRSVFSTLGDLIEATFATSVRRTPPMSDAAKE